MQCAVRCATGVLHLLAASHRWAKGLACPVSHMPWGCSWSAQVMLFPWRMAAGPPYCCMTQGVPVVPRCPPAAAHWQGCDWPTDAARHTAAGAGPLGKQGAACKRVVASPLPLPPRTVLVQLQRCVCQHAGHHGVHVQRCLLLLLPCMDLCMPVWLLCATVPTAAACTGRVVTGPGHVLNRS